MASWQGVVDDPWTKARRRERQRRLNGHLAKKPNWVPEVLRADVRTVLADAAHESDRTCRLISGLLRAAAQVGDEVL